MRHLIRPFVPQGLRNYVRMTRAYAEHERLRPHWKPVDPHLTTDGVVLNTVFELLDRMPKDAVAAEIGVATGGLSKQILARSAPKKLYLIDPWDNENHPDYGQKSLDRIERDLAGPIASGQVEIRRGYSFDELPKLPENHLDWVYVDAAHDYEGVKKDLELCLRVVKPGGIIAGHDYVRWVSPTERYGVVEAVNEFANRTQSRLIYMTNDLDKHDSYAFALNK